MIGELVPYLFIGAAAAFIGIKLGDFIHGLVKSLRSWKDQ